MTTKLLMLEDYRAKTIPTPSQDRIKNSLTKINQPMKDLNAMEKTDPQKETKRKEYQSKRQFKTWVERIESGHLTKPQIIKLCSLLRGYVATSLTQDQIGSISELVRNSNGLDIDQCHTDQGLNFLRKKDGKTRNNQATADLGQRERSIVENFSHFKFVSCTEVSDRDFAPVFEVFDTNGQSFQYYFSYSEYYNRGVITVVR
jgi:hypothetical protein